MLKGLKREAVLPGLEIGALVSLGYIVQGLGLESADASTAAFLCSLGVVVCPLLDVFDGKKLGWKSWMAAGLAVAGAGVLELGGAKPPCAGDAWALVQPLAFGTAFWKTEQAMKRFPDQTGPLTSLQIGTVALVSCLWTLCNNNFGLPDPLIIHDALQHQSVVAAIFWTGLVTTALTVLVETWALARLSSAETTVLFSTEPLWGSAFASYALGEHLGVNAFLGGSLILAACTSSFLGPEEAVDSEATKESSDKKGPTWVDPSVREQQQRGLAGFGGRFQLPPVAVPVMAVYWTRVSEGIQEFFS